MTTITLKAPAISCQHCVNTIKTELADVGGVAKVEADPNTKLVVVAFDAPATQAEIEAKLAEIGYPAER
ncbi:MAG: heavy-metal-associated domain-containing protein [Anaerolineales bacterium]|nr:heavy-metal-associated domain-containing protein [Anaerolineales bacterium]